MKRRAALAIVVTVLVTVGLLVATRDEVFAPAAPTLALAPAAPTACAAVGPYAPPPHGSVGLPEGTRTCGRGSLTITTPGAIVDGWEIRGGIVVDAPDVVVRRSRLTGDGSTSFGITTTEAGSVRIEDTTLTGDFPAAAIAGERWSGERVDIVAVTGDGARLGPGARLRNSLVRPTGSADGVVRSADAPADADADGHAQAHGVVLGDDTLLESATVVVGHTAGSAVLISATAGPVTVRGNVLGGGRFTVRQDGTAPGAVTLTGNRFRRGAAEAPVRLSRGTVVADNTYVDGGMLPAR